MPWMKEGDSVTAVDSNVKNKWRWAWLDEKNDNKEPHRLWCVKLDKAGVCLCRVCISEIKNMTLYLLFRLKESLLNLFEN